MVRKTSIDNRIQSLYEQSERELDACSLPNGALVAANSDLPIYPSTAENYRFSWARDAAYQLLAAHAINPRKAEARTINYAKWLTNVQGFSQTGLYIKRYGTNGALDVRYGEQHQPDQAASLIGSFDVIIPENNPYIDTAIVKMANGLVQKWNGQSLGHTQDLWENRETSAGKTDVFTYTIASVIYGLDHAIKRMKDTVDTETWQRAKDEMQSKLDTVSTRHYLRKINSDQSHTDTDNSLDSSLSGLLYPFAIHNTKTQATITAIHNTLYRPGLGVYRYSNDTYDGIVREGSQEATAGAWPLLTFWNAISLHSLSNDAIAKDMILDTVERLEREYHNGHLPDNIIPEQIYPDDERQGKGVLPLAWSHAKFILAAKALQLVD